MKRGQVKGGTLREEAELYRARSMKWLQFSNTGRAAGFSTVVFWRLPTVLPQLTRVLIGILKL